jgi:hypothetical protein
MSEPCDDGCGLSGDELVAEEGVALPDRQAMSTVKLGAGFDNFAMPINEAIAMNISSSNSWAIADADQIVLLDQDATEEGTA